MYNYTTDVDICGYLKGHYYTDITFIVSQVSFFTFCLKCSHELTLEQIDQYLKWTIKEGLILKSNTTTDKFEIDIYVDAAFDSGLVTEQGKSLTMTNLVLALLL